MGLVTNAYFGFKKAFETSNNQAVREGALYYIIRILIELGNRAEADRVMAMLKQQFPNSNYLILASRVLSSR